MMTVETGNIKTADMIIGCYEYVSTTTYQDALIRGFPNRIDGKFVLNVIKPAWIF